MVFRYIEYNMEYIKLYACLIQKYKNQNFKTRLKVIMYN